jgi:hypothetical protein
LSCQRQPKTVNALQAAHTRFEANIYSNFEREIQEVKIFTNDWEKRNEIIIMNITEV